jgi:uncharacterized protein DUF4145
MPQPRYNWREDNVLAPCPGCDGAVTSFDTKGHGNTVLGTVIVDRSNQWNGTVYSRILWRFFRCAVCNTGGVAKIHDNGSNQTAVLESFLPAAVQRAPLPAKAPDDVVKEFREAELDAAHGALRSGSALLRSVLEKTLSKNGYEEVEVVDAAGNKRKTNKLIHRIEAAAEDGVITQARKRRAHENIRVLGNDILHEDWREVAQEEFDDAHKYSQRILEDLYDDRPTVEKILKANGRPFTPA